MTDFDALYQADPDPWSVATAWYERRKLSILMAALPGERYRQAFEPGCGNGAATRMLARRCDAVHAIDASPAAISHCRRALDEDGLSNVRADVAALPGAWPAGPDGRTDLIVVSELAYYFTEAELRGFLLRCARMLSPGGDWLMCHYRKPFHDRLQDTDRLHDQVGRLDGLSRIVAHDDRDFRLDVWRKRKDPAS